MTSKPFTLEDLETQVARTQGRGDWSRRYPYRLVVAIEEEASEARDAAASFLLGGCSDEQREALKLELGDVLNVVTAIAMHAGFTLREVAEANDAKMRARMPEGCGQ